MDFEAGVQYIQLKTACLFVLFVLRGQCEVKVANISCAGWILVCGYNVVGFKLRT